MISFFKKFINNIKYILFSKKNYIDIKAPLKIEFKNKHYYIDNQQFTILDIDTIDYGVSSIMDKNPTYYIKLNFIEKKKNMLLHNGFELVNKNSFMNVINKFDIPVLPTIVKAGPYIVKGFSLSLDYECSINEKYLVSIYYSDLQKKNFNFNSLSIKELLDKPKKYISTVVNNDRKFNIKVLSEKITFSRGYGVYPVLDNEIIVEDILYSFDEEEIKIKIIELFDKYNK